VRLHRATSQLLLELAIGHGIVPPGEADVCGIMRLVTCLLGNEINLLNLAEA